MLIHFLWQAEELGRYFRNNMYPGTINFTFTTIDCLYCLTVFLYSCSLTVITLLIVFSAVLCLNCNLAWSVKSLFYPIYYWSSDSWIFTYTFIVEFWIFSYSYLSLEHVWYCPLYVISYVWIIIKFFHHI